MSITSLGAAIGSPVASTPGPSSSVTSTEAKGAAFEEELSRVLLESLKKIGTDSGELNVSVRPGTDAASAGSRQIIITYRPAGSSISPFHLPTSVESPESSTTESGSAAGGLRDQRDASSYPARTFSTTGAPQILPTTNPIENQYGYQGPAAHNPYFTTPSNPLRGGYVEGFAQWFEDNAVVGPDGVRYGFSRAQNATADGAAEALRLVQMFAPGASLVTTNMEGPYSSQKPTLHVQLPDGRMLNAGLVLVSYYSNGAGVTAASDLRLKTEIESA